MERFRTIMDTLFPQDEPKEHIVVRPSVLREKDFYLMWKLGDEEFQIIRSAPEDGVEANSEIWLRPEPHKVPPRSRIICHPILANIKDYEPDVNLGDVSALWSLLHRAEYAWVGDLRCSFFQLPVLKRSTRWYRAKIILSETGEVRMVEFCRVAMGARSAPEAMQTTLESITYDGISYCVVVLIHIDNMFIGGKKEAVQRYVAIIKGRLLECGLLLGEEEEGTRITFKGILIDLREKTLAMTSKKVEKLNTLISQSTSTLSVRDCLSNYSFLLYYSRLLWRFYTFNTLSFQFEVRTYISNLARDTTLKKTTLNSDAQPPLRVRNLMATWMRDLGTTGPVYIPPTEFRPAAVIVTDASEIWGLAGAIITTTSQAAQIRVWAEPNEKREHRKINSLELRALALSGLRIPTESESKKPVYSIHWIGDSEVAGYVATKGVATTTQLNNELMWWDRIRMSRGLYLTKTEHVPTHENPVDNASRGKGLSGEDREKLATIGNRFFPNLSITWRTDEVRTKEDTSTT